MIRLNRKTVLSLGIGLLFSAIALYFTFENIPLGELGAYLKKINYWWIIPSLAFALLSYAIRVWRWQVILLPVKRSGFTGAFHPLVIGFMLNCVMPGRIGEIARPAIYYKRENVEFSKVLGTVAIERIIDALCLLIFFIYILTVISIDESITVTFGSYALTYATLNRLFTFTLELSAILIAAILLVSLSKTRMLIKRVIVKIPDLFLFLPAHARETARERIFLKIARFVENLSAGFEILKNPGCLVLCLAQSFVLWWLLGLSFWVLAFGCPGIRISFLQAFAVEIIICFAIMLPSVPGYWGLWEAGGVFGLMIFGVPAKEAAGMTLTYHFFHLVPVILTGLVSAMVIGGRIMQTTHSAEAALHLAGHGKSEDGEGQHREAQGDESPGSCQSG